MSSFPPVCRNQAQAEIQPRPGQFLHGASRGIRCIRLPVCATRQEPEPGSDSCDTLPAIVVGGIPVIGTTPRASPTPPGNRCCCGCRSVPVAIRGTEDGAHCCSTIRRKERGPISTESRTVQGKFTKYVKTYLRQVLRIELNSSAWINCISSSRNGRLRWCSC